MAHLFILSFTHSFKIIVVGSIRGARDIAVNNTEKKPQNLALIELTFGLRGSRQLTSK